jgi:hypothetical protein
MTTVRIRPLQRFDYEETSDPLVTTNPPCVPVTWMNLTTGELFICTDNTIDSNVWVGQIETDVP